MLKSGVLVQFCDYCLTNQIGVLADIKKLSL